MPVNQTQAMRTLCLMDSGTRQRAAARSNSRHGHRAARQERHCRQRDPFTGHTEFLAELTEAPPPVMMLVAGDLRVALASTHMPLREVADYLTPEHLKRVLRILHADLQDKFGIDEPEIVVCGLNPHAGEGGHLGTRRDPFIPTGTTHMRGRDSTARPTAGRHGVHAGCRSQGRRARDVPRPGLAGTQVRGLRTRR